MALILEVRDARGNVRWHALAHGPLTIGRALTNDIIIDDPYVDGRHARLAVSDDGRLQLHDSGSVNGVLLNEQRSAGAIDVLPGVAVRIGRTTLRFRDQDEAVAPALVDAAESPAPPPADTSVQREFVPRSPRWQVGLLASFLAVAIGNAWLTSIMRSPWGVAIAAGLVAMMFLCVWAFAWAATARGTMRKIQFARHLTVASAAFLGALLLFNAEQWIQFLFPGNRGLVALIGLAMFALMVAAIAEHLSTSSLSWKKRWRVAALVVAGIVAPFAIIGSVSRNTNLDVNAVRTVASLKPLHDRLVPAGSIEDFTSSLNALRSEVDKLKDEEK